MGVEGLYRDIDVRVLADDAATRDGVLDGLEWLENDTRPEDVASVRGKAVLFLDTCHAGNVARDALPRNLRHADVQERSLNDVNRFINELTDAENGVVVFSAATGRQVALESKTWQNGAFTRAVVEGVDGGGDLDKDGAVMVSELGQFVDRRVRELTDGEQTPTLAMPASVPNFPIAVVK
jgi:uncharacterized caspase-like protein